MIVLVQAVISVVSDFSFAISSIVLLWRMQIDLKTKLRLWTLMCLGFSTGTFSLIRTILNDEALPLDRTYDGIINWIVRIGAPSHRITTSMEGYLPTTELGVYNGASRTSIV